MMVSNSLDEDLPGALERLAGQEEAETASLPPSESLKAYPKKALGSTSERPPENATLWRSVPVKAPYPMLAAEDRSTSVREQP